MELHRLATCSFLLLAGLAWTGNALGLGPKQGADGASGHLSKAFRAKLKNNRMRILVPTYIPKGFQFEHATASDEKEIFMRTVDISYVAPHTKKRFRIQFASDGLGDPFFDLPNGDTLDPTGTLRGKNKIFGTFNLDFVNKAPHLMWHTTWYELKQSGFPRNVLVAGENFAPAEGKKIVESLRWLAN